MPGLTQNEAILLSLCYSEGKLGAAVYDQQNTTVNVMHDVTEADDFAVVNSLIYQVEPSIILVCKSQDLEFVRFLSDKCCEKDTPVPDEDEEEEEVEDEASQGTVRDSQVITQAGDDDEEESPFRNAVLHLLPSNIYRYDMARTRLKELFGSEGLSRSEKDLILEFRVDTTCHNMTRAFGALLKYMDATRIGVEFETYDVRTPISSIKTFAADQMVEMDRWTYRALDIYTEDKKKEGGWRKALKQDEQTSLFSLMNRCRSTPGKHMLMRWFDHPTLNREILRNRQKAISFFIQDSNMEMTSEIQSYLGKIRNVKVILKKMRAGVCKVPHWKSFHEMVVNLVAIGRCLGNKIEMLAILDDYARFFGNKLAEIAAVLRHICDFDESVIEDRLVANLGVDPDLDESKRLYRQLPNLLTRVAQEEARRLGAETCSVGYVPIVGYLVALPTDFPVDHFPDLKMIYCTEDQLHMKSKRMNRLDEELGDIKMQIIDKETDIALRLQNLITDASDVMIGAMRGAAVLDAIISMALSARYYGWNCPIFTDASVIEAINCVHPLLKARARKRVFVPNPISSGGDDTKMKIFTGPNACGKSVYMKQVAILAFLAHIGSFVPADRCIIGPINRIITRMYTVDGVLDGLSTFARDLSQVAVALRRANEFSLVILDEFGKGTLTEVGLSLLACTLNHWVERGAAMCPHIMVASHFHSLPQYVNDPTVLSYQTFEVIRKGNKLNFMHRLVAGVINCSYASYMALRMGVPDEVVDRANEFYLLLKEGKDHTHLSNLNQEELAYDFLCDQMHDFMTEFDSWDIENDAVGLLERAKRVLLEETERVVADEDVISQPPEDPIEGYKRSLELEEEREVVGDGEEEEALDESEEEEVQEVETTPQEELIFPPGYAATPSLTGILKKFGRKEDRSMQSVCFASTPEVTQLASFPVSPVQNPSQVMANLMTEMEGMAQKKRNREGGDSATAQKKPRDDF